MSDLATEMREAALNVARECLYGNMGIDGGWINLLDNGADRIESLETTLAAIAKLPDSWTEDVRDKLVGMSERMLARIECADQLQAIINKGE